MCGSVFSTDEANSYVTHGWGDQQLGRLGRVPVLWVERKQEAPLQTPQSSPGSDHTGLTGAVTQWWTSLLKKSVTNAEKQMAIVQIFESHV